MFYALANEVNGQIQYTVYNNGREVYRSIVSTESRAAADAEAYIAHQQ